MNAPRRLKRKDLAFALDRVISRIWRYVLGTRLYRAPVVITGMHRSGTSLVAGTLSAAGLFLGKKSSMMPPTEANPRGYFENEKIVMINERILSCFGLDWKSARGLPRGWNDHPGIKRLRRDTEDILNREFFGMRRWGMKDPRFCLTLDFWKRILPGMRVVIVERDPEEIGLSLSKREGRVRDAEALISHYRESLELSSRGQAVMPVNFKDMIARDTRVISAVMDFAGLGPKVGERVLSFIEKDLYRSRKGK